MFCKLKSLEDVPLGKLAGKMGTLMDESDSSGDINLVLDKPKASRYSLEDLRNRVQVNSLLLLDRGLYYLFIKLNYPKNCFYNSPTERSILSNKASFNPEL